MRSWGGSSQPALQCFTTRFLLFCRFIIYVNKNNTAYNANDDYKSAGNVRNNDDHGADRCNYNNPRHLNDNNSL